MKNLKMNRNLTGFSFVLPSILALLTFIIVPIIMAVLYSFTKYNGAAAPEWIGLANFTALFKDISIRYAFRNTVVYVLVSVPFQTILSLVLASILAQNFQNRFGSFVRSTLFIPVICSASLVATIWYYLFSNDPNGMVNTLGALFGMGAVDWLGRENTALAVICFVNIWKGVGYFLVIYYAGIMDIPRTLFEAAEVDGASKMQQFFYITIPSIKSITYLVVTLCTIWSFQVFDIAYIMTAGGPGYGTTSLVYRIYVEAFQNWKFGYASAIACVMLVIIATITLIQRRLFKETVN